jgi:16S rRNA (cytosine967-C5)-methyltransferase
VLRGLLRDKPGAPEAASFDDEEDYLGVRYSFPTWIVRRFRETFGIDRLEAILEGCNAPAQTAVTVNRTRTSREQVAEAFASWDSPTVASEFCEDSLLVTNSASARSHEAQAAGTWWIQSESSAMPVDILNPQPDETVLDVCSGRGNKAMQTAARRGEESMGLTCIERDVRKVDGLRDRLASAGFAAAIVTGDAIEIASSSGGRYDRIMLDAPCSGIGVVGRHPEARWRKAPGDGERLGESQRAFLDALLPCLHPGGVLVYAVCSVDRRETTQVIEEALKRHNVERGLIPARYESMLDANGDAIVPPGIGGRDGFFISRLERRP